MQRIRSLFLKLRGDARGLTTIEYAIILCVIVAVSVGVWDQFGGKVNEALQTSTDAIGGYIQQ